MVDIHTHKKDGGLLSEGAENRGPGNGGALNGDHGNGGLLSGDASGAILSVETGGFTAGGPGLYSVGFHPWNLGAAGPSAEEWELFEEMAARPEVVAVGECGLDLLKGPVLAVQMNVFRRQAETAGRLGKPVIIHCVKGYEQMIGLKKMMNPEVPWIIHGFRGKASVAKMLVKAGFYLSVGEKFNPAALAEIPEGRLFIETDESPLTVGEIGAAVASAMGISPEKLEGIIDRNFQECFRGGTGS